MSDLAVDPHALDGAGTTIISTGAGIGSTLATVTATLSGSAGMCGDDPVGAAMGRSYDTTSQSLLQAMVAARNGLTNIGDGVRVSAYNYARADASSDVSGRSQPLPAPTATGRISAASPPSSVGSGADAPAGWGWVAKYIGMIWPNGDPGKLRVAAAAWTAAGTELLNTELAVAGPMGVVGAQKIPEADAMGRAFGDSVRAAGQVLANCATIAAQLTSYAARIEATRAAIIDLLARICDPMTGIKIVWDFLTQDDEDEIEKIAADIKTVVDNFGAQASALAAQMAPVIADAAAIAADMTRWADREWKHFLEDTTAGQQFNGMGQTVKGFTGQGVDLVKDAWKYSPQRAWVDPEGSRADYQSLVEGMAPLVGLGGDGAPGVAESWKQVGKETVHWDLWQENPAEALGRSLFDVATFFVPGGALSKLGKVGSGAAHAADDVARTAPRLTGAGVNAVDDLPAPVAPHPGAPAPKPAELPGPPPRQAEPTTAPRPTETPGSGAPKPTEPKPVSAPGEPRSAPTSAVDPGRHGPIENRPTPTSIPTRSDPALAPGSALRGDGPASAYTAPHTPTAPINPSTPLSAAPTAAASDLPAVGSPSPATVPAAADTPERLANLGSADHGSGHASQSATPDQHARPTGDQAGRESADGHPAGPQDAVRSHELQGDGWERVPDKPDDPTYGQPLPEHWSADSYPDLDRIDPKVRELISDPDAPYGRDTHGTPLTKDQYEERYNKFGPNGEHYNNYPPNDGASPGTRIKYNSIEAFIRDYGLSLDRLGEPDGRYLAIRPDGIAASFEARGLPIESLNLKYYSYELSGTMPEGFSVEISEVAPAFGREGGSLQILFHNEKGAPMSINDVYEAGMLR